MKSAGAGLRIVWKYWRHPALWPAVARLVRTYFSRRLNPTAAARESRRRERSRHQGQAWCAKRAISINQLTRALPFPFAPTDPAEAYPEIFQAAEERVAACPVPLGGGGNLILLYSLAKALRARTVVETGVAYGWSSLAMLLALQEEERAQLFSVDLPYLKYQNDDWVGVAVPPELHGNWRLYRMADKQGVPRALKIAGLIDLAHYDSDKTPEGRAFGYDALWRGLRPGGVLVSDDVGDNLAFKEFADRAHRRPIVVRHDRKFQGILIK